ncbi:YkvI family membrane protein [Solibacillus silvestris]|uniref:YkvI family membrane protein n=1 Tax=Solibacillus silvestris TaxID=76853 RepID=UPI003F7D77F6
MKKSIQIAGAFVSLVVGAGFASGQEIMQYFTSFGVLSIFGCVAATIIFAFLGMSLAQIGSDLQTSSHKEGIHYIGGRFLGPVLDQLISFVLFGIGIVMLAGAGSTFNQMYNLEQSFGSMLMALAVIFTLLLNADSIIKMMAALMPYLLGIIFILLIYSLFTMDYSINELNGIAKNQPSATSHWLPSAILYVSYNIAAGAAMLIVMGGTTKDRKAAARGGALGGMILGLLILLINIALFAKMDVVAGVDMPTLELAKQIHPAAGIIMSFILLAMIYSTAVGTLYILAVRIAKPDRFTFKIVVMLLCLAGFAVSLIGFTTLIGKLYVIMGYLGMGLIVMILFSSAYKTGRQRHS